MEAERSVSVSEYSEQLAEVVLNQIDQVPQTAADKQPGFSRGKDSALGCIGLWIVFEVGSCSSSGSSGSALENGPAVKHSRQL